MRVEDGLDLRGATKVTLTYGEDEQGVHGWLLDRHTYNGYLDVAAQPELLAHDIVEHVNGLNAIGTSGDELQAAGATWHVRGEWSDMSRGNNVSYMSPDDTLSYEVTQEWEKYVSRGYSFGVDAPEPEECSQDETFEYIIESAGSYIRKEAREDKYNTLDEEELKYFLSKAYDFLCVGYNKSQAKGPTRDRNALFWGIAEALRPSMRFGDIGMVMSLSYKKDGTARASSPDWEHNNY